MGMSPLVLILFATVLWVAVPGAAADPFDMPANFAAFEHLANGEPPFTAVYGQLVDSLYDLSQSSASSAGAPGTVRPQDTLYMPQFVEAHPSTIDALRTPPSSSGPTFYMPPQPRPDTYNSMDLDSSTVVGSHPQRLDSNNAQWLAPRQEEMMAAYSEGAYHAGDRMASGRSDGTPVVMESATSGRRRPLIVGGYPCVHCPGRFNRQRDLNLHARTHNPQQECPECDRRFVSRREVSRHVESVHRLSRRYQCDHCGSAFSRKDNLDRHVGTVHRGLRRAGAVVLHQHQ